MRMRQEWSTSGEESRLSSMKEKASALKREQTAVQT
jgi:hypothetical protein